MPRILTFSPYAAHRAHTNYEVTFTRAAQLRGAQVKHIVCDSALGECDMAWFVMHPRGKTKELCDGCRLTQQRAMEEGGVPFEWIGQHLSHEERAKALEWSQSVPKAQLETAYFENWPLGEWVISSVVSTFRVAPIDLDNPLVERVFRSYLFGAAVTAMAWTRILDEWTPDAAIIFNARQAFPRVAFNLARARGIRVLVHERPLTAGTIFLVENENCLSPAPFQEFWREWRDVPLTRAQLEQTKRWFQERRYGGAQMHILFAQAPESLDVRARFGLENGRKLWALFTSSTDEFYGDPALVGPFGSQEAWIEEIVQWVGARDDCDLIIRVHPSLSGRGETGRAPQALRYYETLQTRLPPNVFLVEADDSLSSYDLVDAADLGLAFGSTVGLEMLATGKPVVSVAPLPIYQSAEGVFLTPDEASLPDVLEHVFDLKPQRTFQRAAFRCAYQFFFGMQMPFPLVEWRSRHESAVKYTSPDALREGADPTLDRICNFLLKGTPLFSSPEASGIARLPNEEDAFFTEIENNANWLRMSETEHQSLRLREARLNRWDALRQKARHVLPAPLVQFVGQFLAARRSGAFKSDSEHGGKTGEQKN